MAPLELTRFNYLNKPLLTKTNEKFDEIASHNSLKNRLRGVLMEFAAIKAMTECFPHKKGKTIVTVKKKGCLKY